MLLLVGAFLISLIPALGLFFWLRRLKEDEKYKSLCNKAFVKGLIAILPITLVSATFSIIESLLHLGAAGIVIKSLFHKFIVLALAEELVKGWSLFHFAKKNEIKETTWLDIIVFMTIIGTAFGLAEDLLYAFGTNAMQMLVRGITSGHSCYGFLMGYYIGKRYYTGDKKWFIPALLVPWFFHGLYDFALTPELLEMNDLVAFVPVLIAIFELVVLIYIFFFTHKAKTNEKYTKTIPFENIL